MNTVSNTHKVVSEGISSDKHSTKVARDNEIIRGMTQKRIKFFGLTVAVTLVSLLIFVGLGYFLDITYGTKPVFILLGVAFSYVATQLTLVNLIKHLTSKKDDRN
ncbi:AtpZ/AtpI family protein [Candidatus Peregrinibacteria bacterium]|nr:AtpZ/AtpI family protein [Candidatus Peregrinibacteria bacterium]